MPLKKKIRSTKKTIRLTSKNLGKQVKQQTHEITLKDKQLKVGADKQLRAEEQIHIRTKAMDATADGIFIIDAQKSDYPVIYANPSFQTMTGYNKRDIIGRNYFSLYGAEADRRIVEEIKQTIDRGKSFHGEMLNFQKNGKKYWNLLHITAVRDSNGNVTHYVGIQTDITLMQQRDLEIKEQREELLHVTRVGKLAEFVSSLAHEISQPLTAILSYAQAAQRMLSVPTKNPQELNNQINEIFQYIINDDQRAAAVIRRLRSLLKKNVSEMKPIHINTLIKETIVLISTDLNVRNISLTTQLDQAIPVINGDSIQLQQVLLNLISNSFEALETTKKAREIVISTSLMRNKIIMVRLKDNGCGIPAQNISKLFERFFTSKTDGLGMGLSISRSIVEAHGGHLILENNSDHGVTFQFTLPTNTKAS